MWQWLTKIDWDKVCRTAVHAALMGGSIYIGMHPELAPYAAILQYIGNNINSA